MIRIAPTVAIQQVTSMPCILVVVEFKLIALAYTLEHDTQEYPGTHVKTSQLDKHLPFGFSHLSQPWPVHFAVTSFNDSIADSEEIFAGVGTKHVFCFDFPGLQDSFLGLLIELLIHDFEFFCGLGQGGFLILELIDCSVVLVGELLMVFY